MNLPDIQGINEVLSFLGVLVRVSVIISILPFFGDRTIPTMVKIFFSLCLSFVVFPVLLKSGAVHPDQAAVWGSSVFRLVAFVAKEASLALLLGFAAKIAFDTVQFAGNLIGTYMGYAAANQFDPHQESQTQLISQFHFVLAMLLFLALDGHYLFVRALVDSFRIVGLGTATFEGEGIVKRLLQMSGELITVATLLSAPMAICTFLTNMVFGILGKAMPQMNILVLSFGVSSLTGFAMLFLGMSVFDSAVTDLFARTPEHLMALMRLAKGS